ncbi:MAG: diguanylate cyclase [Desulfobacterales bacterium]|nr:diguanylate cyclase [Desulfobacterales bacterium]
MTFTPTESPTILIVDDYPINLRVLLDSLKGSGCKPLVARNGESALKQADFAKPDIILLDVMMPGIDGFETCRQLKQQESTKQIPVIFMTALSETIDKIKGFEVGGIDYITKPFDATELIARIRVHLELKRAREELEYMNQQLYKTNQKLLEYQEQLEILARIDPLTQLSNRRDILERIEKEKKRSERNLVPFSVVITDIDNFKTINDTYGHDCGDHVLVTISNIFRSIVRKQDHVARWGGEEFLLVLVETDGNHAQLFSERLREAITSHEIMYHDHHFCVTMTFGICECQDISTHMDTCLKHADRALYAGKKNGKNCVMLFDDKTN